MSDPEVIFIKTSGEFKLSFHYPSSEEGLSLLAEKAALIRARACLEYISSAPACAEEKIAALEKLSASLSGCSGEMCPGLCGDELER